MKLRIQLKLRVCFLFVLIYNSQDSLIEDSSSNEFATFKKIQALFHLYILVGVVQVPTKYVPKHFNENYSASNQRT